MPHTKLFDNHRQIVSVGLEKEWSSSQCSLLSSKSERQSTLVPGKNDSQIL